MSTVRNTLTSAADLNPFGQLVRREDNSQYGWTVIVRKFPGWDASVAETAADNLEDVSYSGTLIVDRQTITGTFETFNVRCQDDGDRGVTIFQSVAAWATGEAASDAEVTLVGQEVGRRQRTVQRVWHRRTATAKGNLLGDSATPGIAASDFTVDVAGSDTGNYTHQDVRVIDHHDKSFTVVQVGVFQRIFTFFSIYDQASTDAEVLEDSGISMFKTGEAPDAYEDKYWQRWRKVFADSTPSTAISNAFDYVKHADMKGQDTSSSDRPASAVFATAGNKTVKTFLFSIRYNGKDGDGNETYVARSTQLLDAWANS